MVYCFPEILSSRKRTPEAEKKAICDKSASDVESTTISPDRSLQMRLVFFFPLSIKPAVKTPRLSE